MPSSSTQEHFVTLSHSSVDTIKGTKEYLEYIKKSIKTHLIIKELGKKQQYPHYHIYVKLPKKVRVDNYTRELKLNYFTELNEAENRCFLKVKAVTDLTKLIGFYFQKEDDFEVVSDKNVNLEEMKNTYNKRPKSKHTKYRFVSYNELPFFLIDYCTDNNIELVSQSSIEDLFKKSKKTQTTSRDLMFSDFTTNFNRLWTSLFQQRYNLHAYDNKKLVIRDYLWKYYLDI